VSLSQDVSLDKRIISEKIQFRGHHNILGTHRNTLEITKDEEISKRADCIIGVQASKGCSDLDSRILTHINSGGKLEFEISVQNLSFHFSGFGSPDLELSDPREIVLRKSDFLSPRTLAIGCDAAAVDIPREIIRALSDPGIIGTIQISAQESSEIAETSVGLNALEVLANNALHSKYNAGLNGRE
jgi:uncharacterized protein